MAYVITQNCCKDASCVPVCPVDCIRPVGTAGEPTSTEMLYIDPESCIDCGACMEECPVNAIHYEEDLPADQLRYKDINAAYFQRHPLEAGTVSPPVKHSPVEPGSLRVAVVGAGPAACYAASELIAVDGVEVDLFERLPTPYGLIRAGVAPDHQSTKSVVSIFRQTLASERLSCHMNVEIGRHLSHDDLMAHHHAVIYAVGSSTSRDLGIEGENLPGHHPAADFVGWYNGHPDHADHDFDLSGERAVVVGNGNVALDVARVLLADPETLAKTDIAHHALESLSHSRIQEVVILGRRGPREAAYSVGEFMALGHLPGIDVVIDGGDLESNPDDDIETATKLKVAREYAHRSPNPDHKRIVFRFLSTPKSVLGDQRVTGVNVSRDGADEIVETSLLLRSIGYHGRPIAGLEFSDQAGTIANRAGRVIGADAQPVPGVYVAGWIKRGPRGVIGTNRSCAEETVRLLFEDHDNGVLARPISDREALMTLMAERGITSVDWDGWRAIDAAERERGTQASRPRVKFVAVHEMLTTAATASP